MASLDAESRICAKPVVGATPRALPSTLPYLTLSSVSVQSDYGLKSPFYSEMGRGSKSVDILNDSYRVSK